MKSGKMICVLLTVCMALAVTACGTNGKVGSQKQTASAYLDQSENTAVEVTVDLSGGWSVEFARGAAYLYDSEITDGKEGVAMLITLDRDVYEEDMAEAVADKNHKETDSGVYYTRYGNEGAYLTALNDSAYILITAKNRADLEAIVSRFALALAY